MKLRYTPEAISDMEAISSYISDVLYNPNAAKRIVRGILDSCSNLKSQPNLGLSVQDKTGYETELRVLICEKHMAFYRVESDCVSIARVLSGRQDYLHILFGSI